MTTKAITSGTIPTPANFATRNENPEFPVLASSRVDRKTIKVMAAARPITVVSPRVAIAVTVDTVDTVVVIILIFRLMKA